MQRRRYQQLQEGAWLIEAKLSAASAPRKLRLCQDPIGPLAREPLGATSMAAYQRDLDRIISANLT
jgi:hypothetical protein